ncbi:MAG: carbohydrate ABC transporter permease [Eisenbergiella massiliensis]
MLPGALPIFNVILLMNFFLGLPKSLEEAAVIDGAGPMTVLLKIMIPCAKPCLATISLFSIVGSWNDFFSGLIYIQKINKYPIMTYIQSLSVISRSCSKRRSSALENVTELSNRNLNAAKIVVAVVPLLLIYPFLQKYLITGSVMGSVKE